MQPKEVVDVGDFWREWSRCLTFKHQRDMLYRFGKFDDCSRQWSDFKLSVKAKMTKDETEALRMLEQTHMRQTAGVSTTRDVIWEFKDTPGWQ